MLEHVTDLWKLLVLSPAQATWLIWILSQWKVLIAWPKWRKRRTNQRNNNLEILQWLSEYSLFILSLLTSKCWCTLVVWDWFWSVEGESHLVLNWFRERLQLFQTQFKLCRSSCTKAFGAVMILAGLKSYLCTTFKKSSVLDCLACQFLRSLHLKPFFHSSWRMW